MQNWQWILSKKKMQIYRKIGSSIQSPKKTMYNTDCRYINIRQINDELWRREHNILFTYQYVIASSTFMVTADGPIELKVELIYSSI